MIHEAFAEDGFSVEKGKSEKTDFDWQVISGKIDVRIVKFKDVNDSIRVYGAIAFVGLNNNQNLSQPSINNIFYELRTKYLEIGLDYAFRLNPERNMIEIFHTIHYDGLNKHELMRSFTLVRNMVLWTQQKLRHEVSDILSVLDPDLRDATYE
ncbi:MAG: DUF2299 family protein [Nitrososphaerales archaeon]